MNPTKAQVLKSAETSPEARAALVELFPDYFTSPKMDVENDNRNLVRLASQITPRVNKSFMKVCDKLGYWSEEDVSYRESFFLSGDSDTRWKIVEYDCLGEVFQLLTPVELKK